MDIIDSLRDNAERGRYCGSDYIAAADEIARLRALLELDESGVDGIQCRDATIKLQADEIRKLRAKLEAVQRTVESYHEELAASQARGVTLRDVLLQCEDAMSYMSEYDIPLMLPDNVKAALELPADTTALRERLATERERCAKVCDEEARSYEPSGAGKMRSEAAADCAVEIRALSDE